VRFGVSNKQITQEATDAILTSARTALSLAGVTMADIAWVLPHQPNGRMFDMLARELEIPADKLLRVVGEIGSVGAASIPVSLDRLWRSGKLRGGELVLMVAVGSGISYGAITDLGQPTIAVSTVAQTGEANYQTSGLIGKSLMASGSLPPFVATYIGNTRLLDGGPTQDLPTAILRAAGAELVLAVQPIPKLTSIPRPSDQVGVSYLSKWATSFNPVVRGRDAYRAYLMLFRQAALGHEQHADVSYNATPTSSGAGTWYAGPRIAQEAADSQALKHAIDEAQAHWYALRNDDAPGRVRVNRDTNTVEIGLAVDIGFERAPGSKWRLRGDAKQVLMAVGTYVDSSAVSGLAIELINTSEIPAADYQPLFEAATGLDAEQISYTMIATRCSSVPRFALKILL